MSSTKWLAHESRPMAQIRLYCFCHAGGNVSMFVPWQRLLGGAVEVCGVQIPGRASRLDMQPSHSMEALVNSVVSDLQQQLTMPFAFFGHSLGALIAFEVARALRLLRLPEPRHLIVSGCDAPQMRGPRDPLHELDDTALIDVLSRYGGTPAAVLEHRDLMNIVLPAIRADFALSASYSYRAGPLLTSPVSALAGRGDEHVNLQTIGEWSRETVGPFRLDCFDGDHFFIESAREAVVRHVESLLLPASGALGQPSREIGW